MLVDQTRGCGVQAALQQSSFAWPTARSVDSIHYIAQPTPTTCGQACIAMLAGVSVEEVCQVMDNDSTTSYEDMTGALDHYGFKYLPSQPYQGSLPDVCLPLVQFPTYDHSVLYYRGKFYDPEFGVLDECQPGGAVVEFIEILQ